MRILRKTNGCILAISLSQYAFGGLISGIIGDAVGIVISPFVTATGLSASTAGVNKEKADKLEMSDDDVKAVYENRLTDRIREMAKESGKSEGEALQILRAEFACDK